MNPTAPTDLRSGRFSLPRNSLRLAILWFGLAGFCTGLVPAAEDRDREIREAITRIREEGLERSEVVETALYLTDVIGPRLTGSPGLDRANKWTQSKMVSWGLTNVHLDSWGPYGRGWSQKRFSAQVIEPQSITLIGAPKAWSPGFDAPLISEVVYLSATNQADLERYKGKLKGAIVLNGSTREIRPRFDPLATRFSETNLLRYANAGDPARRPSGFRGPFTPPEPAAPESIARNARPGREAGSAERPAGADSAVRPSTNAPGRGPADRFGSRRPSSFRNFSFLVEEGAGLIVTPSSMGDAGTFFVTSATVPFGDGGPFESFTNRSFPRAWSTNAPKIPAQMTLASEDYNRLVRMIQHGEKLKMAVDLQVQFHDDDLMAYNVIAEIPGTDLKDEVVMVGGHLDSWHAGTGATDNATGVAAAMEVGRILCALKLQPRRTVRIALWSGEEQGLLGSRAYVSKHFGRFTTNAPAAEKLQTPKDEEADPSPAPRSRRTPGERRLEREPAYDKLCAYFNLDNGAGKIRGIHLQGNEALRPIFRRWLEPFADLGAETITLSNTGGTDHIPFDVIGLPGFQFIQDPLDYDTRTHHSNMDVSDRILPDDLKQAAVVLAAFVYNAAMADEMLPRKKVQ